MNKCYKIYLLILGILSIYNYSIRVYNAMQIPVMSRKDGGTMKYPNIAAEQARKGMSEEQLAVHLGISRKTLYNWKAEGKIPQNKLEEMATLFGCSIDYLLGRISA